MYVFRIWERSAFGWSRIVQDKETDLNPSPSDYKGETVLNNVIIHTTRIVNFCLLAVVCLLFSGCESPLVLDEVQKTEQSPIRRTDNIQEVSAFQQNIVAVGSAGLILASQDGGATWQRREISSWPSFLDITSCADGLFAALAFEGEVWLSTDRGTTWSRSELPTEEAPQAIQCDPAGVLWVVGSFSTISVSRDGGANWTVSSQDEDVIYTDIQFFGKQTAYIAGEFGTLMKTTDGGANWELMAPMPDEFYPQSMYFENLDKGWVAGLGGVLLATEDGGRTWQVQSTGSLVTLYTMVKADGNIFVVGGEGSLFRYNGTGWTPVDHGQTFRLYLRGIEALPDHRLIVSGPGGVLHVFSIDELTEEKRS